MNDENLNRRIEQTSKLVAGLARRAEILPDEQKALFAEALEELQVAGEELSQQAEELSEARQAADQERQRYLDLFSFAPDAYLVTDAEGVIVEANEAAAALLRVEASALSRKPLLVFIEPVDRKAYYAQLDRLRLKNRLEDWEIYVKPRGGKTFSARVTASTIRGRKGELEGFRWVIRDATEQKKLEQTALLASFPELNPDPVIETDASGHLYYLNPSSKRHFKTLLKDGPSHPWLAEIGEIGATLRRSGAKPVTREVRIGNKWFRQMVYSYAGGSRLRVYGHEITARKRAEESLRESEQKYRDLVENANSIIIRWKPSREITFFNRFALSFFGYSEDEILGQDVRILVPASDSAGHDLSHLLDDIVANPNSYRNNENENVLRNGERVRVQWTNRAVFDEAGRVCEILAVGNDVTAARTAQRELEKSRAEVLTEKQRLEALMEVLPVGVALFDAQGKRTRSNRAFGDVWGGPGPRLGSAGQAAASQAWWADSGEPVGPEEWASELAIREGKPVVGQSLRIRRQDGTTAYILNSAAPIFEADGKITGSALAVQDVTKRVLAEEALKKAHDELELRVKERTEELRNAVKALKTERQRFRDVLDMLPAYVILLTPDYRAPFANRVFKDTFGAFDGRRCYEALFGRAEPCENCRTFKVLETGAPQTWDWVGPNGRQYEVHDYPFADTDGSRFVLEMGVDVTDRNLAEATVQDQADLYTGMLSATPDGFWIHDLEGRILDVNDTYCRMSGYARDELLRMRLWELGGGDSPEDVAAHIRAVAVAGFDRFESRQRRKDGGTLEVEISASHMPWMKRTLVFARDITERRKAEQERLRLAAAVEQTGEGVAISDAEDRVLYVNGAFLRIHGLGRGEVLGRSYEELIGIGLEDQAFQDRLHEMRKRGETWKARLTRRMPDGQERKLDVRISAVRDVSGRIINYTALESDATQEHNLELSVRQLQKMEALGTLAGGIAHDFNNILVPILLNTELAMLDVSADAPLHRHLSLILEATNRGRSLVRQIIAYSRQKEQRREAVDIVLVIREALKLLRPSLPSSVAIREQILTDRALVRGDSTQIHQVIMNLANNAAHAMREAGGQLEVGLSEVDVDAGTAARNPDLRPGPYLKLTMRDTGVGMTPEVMDKAFDPFFTTKKPGEGAGLGLSVVMGIVKSHGGAISVASQPGRGSTFFVFLPELRGVGDEVPGPAAKPIESGKGHILFIDDDEMLVRSVPIMLERLGYAVTALSDADEALARFRGRPDAFDLVLTDQTMPRISGERLAAEMLRIRPGVRILLCTGFSEAVHEEEAKAQGITGFILKPFSMREIADKIREVLET